jgi:hypothetical protein
MTRTRPVQRTVHIHRTRYTSGMGGRPPRGRGACGTGRRGLAPGGAAAAGCAPARDSLFGGEHEEAHQPDQDVFYNGVVVHDDRYHANVRQVPLRAADDVLLVDIALARCDGRAGAGRWCAEACSAQAGSSRHARRTGIQASVVHLVIIALGQYVHRAALLLVHLTRRGGRGFGRAWVQRGRLLLGLPGAVHKPVHKPRARRAP